MNESEKKILIDQNISNIAINIKPIKKAIIPQNPVPNFWNRSPYSVYCFLDFNQDNYIRYEMKFRNIVKIDSIDNNEDILKNAQYVITDNKEIIDYCNENKIRIYKI